MPVFFPNWNAASIMSVEELHRMATYMLILKCIVTYLVGNCQYQTEYTINSLLVQSILFKTITDLQLLATRLAVFL